MYLLILYIPLLNSIMSIFFGKYLGKTGVSLLTIFNMLISLLLSLFIFFEVILSNHICVVKLCKWIDVGLLNIYWEFLFDSLTSIMLFVIILISFCVHIYSIEYMYYDPHLCRFLSYLSLFTFFMLVLVTAGNLLQLFLGWEGVGFCSYLLINFWYTRIAANKAAMKALIINKIGDVALLIGIILFFILYNSLDFTFINCSTWIIKKEINIDLIFFWLNIDYLAIIIFFFLIGASAKSAQIGLHTWLPDAMEGPTPVSALIHAATMVTAGIFLLLRIIHILKYNENSLLIISFLGGITAIVAATIGLFQNDIKKVIAYSTCSQLGYMVLSCGLSNFSGSLFHLMNHAFFKALLFLSAGAIIHSMLDQQDMRRMGLLLKYLPISYIMMLIGSLAIMGIPFLTGFYSKEFIIEYSYTSKTYLNFFLYSIGVLTAFLTSFYSIKLLYLTFYNVTYNSAVNTFYNKEYKIKESGFFVLIALIILFFGSIFIGFIFKDIFIGMGTDVWINNLDTENFKDGQTLFEVEFLPFEIKIIPLFFTILAMFLSMLFINNYYKKGIQIGFYLQNNYLKNLKLSYYNRANYKQKKIYIKKYHTNLFNFFYNAYYFNEIYNFFVYIYRNLGYKLFKNLDKGIIEWLGTMIIVNFIKKIQKNMSKRHKGLIDHFVFVMIFGLFCIIILIYFLDIWLFDLKILGIILLLIILEIYNKK